MAKVVVTFKIMPESPEIDLTKIQQNIKQKITDFAGDVEIKIEQELIAFGLKALKVLFVLDESKGSTDKLEEDIRYIKGVRSVEVTDVRRAIG